MIVTGWKVTRKRDAATVGGVDGGLKAESYNRCDIQVCTCQPTFPLQTNLAALNVACHGLGAENAAPRRTGSYHIASTVQVTRSSWNGVGLSDDVGSRRLWGFTSEGWSGCSHCSTAMSGFMKITHRRSLHVIYTHRFIYKLLCIQPWAIHNTSVEQYMLNKTMHTVHYIMHVIEQVHLQHILETYNFIL